MSVSFYAFARLSLTHRPVDLEALVPESSHYLRPSRSYTLGRAVVSASKSHQRAHDFTIKSNFISSSGAWTLVTGSWTAEQVVSELA